MSQELPSRANGTIIETFGMREHDQAVRELAARTVLLRPESRPEQKQALPTTTPPDIVYPPDGRGLEDEGTSSVQGHDIVVARLVARTVLKNSQ